VVATALGDGRGVFHMPVWLGWALAALAVLATALFVVVLL
jgi:hypothetical protein